jgi:hypothetical protein
MSATNCSEDALGRTPALQWCALTQFIPYVRYDTWRFAGYFAAQSSQVRRERPKSQEWWTCCTVLTSAPQTPLRARSGVCGALVSTVQHVHHSWDLGLSLRTWLLWAAKYPAKRQVS